ncbi:MAG TPA: replication-relaxation family protein [Gaiellaceae bacterium]|nr:replication-relaxation family protein [Gaiellaceae bacterium]
MAVSSQRVLTQTQIEVLFASTPGRTLRYRVERLTRLGLLGRSRPYRDKGSAPFHYWPTRAADAFVRGEPVPRRGKRAEPNPQFLAHAAGLSDLYVVLLTQASAAGLRLHRFQREGEAREPFTAGGPRALAPDALVELHDEHDRYLAAFVELDLGTMSHPRLKTKADGYAAYAARGAWAEHEHPFCPCLLFFTTSEARGLAFLKTLAGQLARHDHSNPCVAWFAAAACAHAHDPGRALVEACWDDLTLSGGGLSLTDCLNAARAPYDRHRAREEAKERDRERRLAELRGDPLVLREHLQERRCADMHRRLERFGEQGREAVYLLLESTDPLDELEREALSGFADYLGEELLAWDYGSTIDEPDRQQLATVERLIHHYRERQRAHVAELIRRDGVLPSLRRAHDDLQAGELLRSHRLRSLADTKDELQIAHEQAKRREHYLAYRKRRARCNAGLSELIFHGSEPAAARLDHALLRRCGSCGEVIYPKPHPDDGVLRAPDRCPYCPYSHHLRRITDPVADQ